MKPSTFDPQLVRAIAGNILTAIERIERRFAGIDSADDFLSSNAGQPIIQRSTGRAPKGLTIS